MIRDALLKLQGEIAAAGKDDEVSKGIGAFLINHIRSEQEDASKILAEGKSLSGCVQAMSNEAMEEAKKKGNGHAAICITDAQGFAMALKYYGVYVPEAASLPVTATNFEVNFDDL